MHVKVFGYFNNIIQILFDKKIRIVIPNRYYFLFIFIRQKNTFFSDPK